MHPFLSGFSIFERGYLRVIQFVCLANVLKKLLVPCPG